MRVRPVPAIAVFLAGLAAGCGSSPSAPTTPPPDPAEPVHSGGLAITGRVIGTVTGEPIAGATVALDEVTLVTDADGAFSLDQTDAGVHDITISGAGLVTRTTRVSVTRRDVTIDVIQDRPPFELTFFRQFGRNAFESESGLEPLRPISAGPRVHIRTVDEAGRPMDSGVLDVVEASLRDVGSIWSGGRHAIEVVERGAGTRQGQPGWITVLFSGSLGNGTCGRATLGSATGRIELNYQNGGCACNGHVVAPRTVRHELGHVHGFWHTSARGGVMSRTWTTRQCDGRPSAREVEHAKYMYARSAGNVDPDTDPGATVLREPGEILVED